VNDAKSRDRTRSVLLNLRADEFHCTHEMSPKGNGDEADRRHPGSEQESSRQGIAEGCSERGVEHGLVVDGKEPPDEPGIGRRVVLENEQRQASHQEVGGGDEQHDREEQGGVDR
jgi:hypothetical protein